MTKFEELKQSFEQIADSKKAKPMASYMKDKFIFYGIQTPQRRACYRELLKSEKKNKKVDWHFLDACWDDDHREFQYVIRDYLLAMKSFISWEDIPKIEMYIRSKQWWDSIDGLDKVIGYIGLSDKRVDGLMRTWACDRDFWVRRLAIDHQLGCKDKTNVDLLEEILRANFGSNEFFVNKAIGWALRDFSKTNPVWVRGFFQKYRKEMAPLSIREGSKYI